MNTEESFKLTRKKLYRMMTMDGIGDMSAGIAILSLGSLIFVDSYEGIFIAICAMAGPLAILLRNKIVVPRIGYYRPESAPDNRDIDPKLSYISIGLLLIVIILGLAYTLGLRIPFLVGDTILVVVGISLSVVVIAVAQYTSIRRLNYYAIVLFALFSHGAWKDYPTTDGMDLVREALGMHIAIFGIVLLITGFALLIRFINKHPIVAREFENEL